MIKFEQVRFVREGRTILDAVDFQMNKQENWVILGRNGSGKTTILEMINGYLFPTSGEIEVLGNRYGQCEIQPIRRKIGYVSQSLLEKLALKDPVWEVVATGEYGFLRFYQEIPPEVRDKALQILEEIGLSHLQDQALGALSQGERKKIMLARALMTAPEILIMDEPCAGLDLYEREQLLTELPKYQNRGIQLIYVTHHLEEISSVFTHVLLLEQGRIAAAGPKHEVITSERLQMAYQTNVQLEWFEDRPWLKVVRG